MKQMLRFILMGIAAFTLYSCDELIVKDISDKEIEILTPSRQAVLTDGIVSFSWVEVGAADYFRLTLVSPAFSRIERTLADTLLTGNRFTPLEALPSGAYEWRIQAFNTEYQTRSQTFAFRMQREKDLSEKIPVLLAPQAGATLSSRQVTFSWEPVAGADGYRLLTGSPESGTIENLSVDSLLTGTTCRVELPDGRYQWQIQAFNAEFRSLFRTGTFQVQTSKDISGETVRILAPHAGASLTSDEVTFSWEALPGTGSYRLWVASPGFENTESMPVDSLLTGTNCRVELPDGNYQWRIQALNEGFSSLPATVSFRVNTVPDISRQDITVVSPQAGSELTTGEVLFSWEAVPGAEQYRIVLVSPDFGQPQRVIEDTCLETTTFRTSLEDGEYQWRIQALNSAYATQPQVLSFRVATQPDIRRQTVTVISPLQNAEVGYEEVVFAWEKMDGATSYHLRVVSPSFGNVQQLMEDITLDETVHRLSLPKGEYQWQIRAFNAAYQTAVQTYSFLRVSRAVDLENRKITIIAPSSGVTLKDPDVVFGWEPLDGAENYRLTLVSPSFDRVEKLWEDITTPETVFRRELPDGDYQWRIQALNEESRTTPQVFSFRVSAAARDISLETITVVAPTPGISTTNQNILFTWEPVTGATKYRLMIASPSFGQVELLLEDVTLEQTSYRIDLPVGSYQWRIQAMNEHYRTAAQTYNLTILP